MKSTFSEAKERAAQDGTELKVGAIVKFLFKPKEEDRDKYQLIGEVQRNANFDTQSCASRAPIEVIEEDLTHAYRNNLLHPDTKAFIEPCIQYKDGLPFVVLADAYIAIKSGTTKEGNSLKAPSHALHEWGFVPGKWLPLEDWMDWDDYYDRDRITPDIEAYATESRKRLPIKYQQVPNTSFDTSLQKTSLSVAGHGWTFSENGIYPRTDYPFNHAFKIFKRKYFAKDSYLDEDGDWVKHLASNFKFFDWGYEIGIVEENVDIANIPNSYPLIVQLYQKLIAALSAIVALLSTPKEEKPLPPYIPKPDRYTIWAQAIQAEESSKPPRPTDVNVRLKNPGNLKYTSYTASLGGKKSTVPGLDGGTFCEFDTYQDGLNALKQFLKDAVDGKLRAYKPTQTLLSFTKVYANPPNDGYATNVAKKLGKTIQTPIKDLVV